MRFFTTAIFILLGMSLLAQTTTTSVQSGDWTRSNTWDNWGPGCGDTIVISSGDKVNVNQQLDFFSSCGTPMFILIEGVLDFKSGKKLKLPCGSGVLVKAGGSIIGAGGGGKSNSIEICGDIWWTSDSGDVNTPTYFGDLYSEDIISITSGDWDQSSTWDCSCDPQFYHSPTVDVGHTVNLNFKSEVNQLTINGILDATGFSDTLSLNGDWINNNSFIPGNAVLRFRGNKSQSIMGSNLVYNLMMDNPNGLGVNSGSLEIIGTLDLQRGNFNTNNSLTIRSDANGTGRIAEISLATITGDITMQRYIDAGATDWRFFSAPISGATLADLNDDFVTSGFPGSDFPLWPTAANPWASIYYYDEASAGIQDSGFVAATSISNSMVPGQGIWVYCGDTIIGTQPFTIDYTGPANVGNVTLPTTYTNHGLPSDDGWNMVGNPYPSTLDWDDPSITKLSINGAIYIWNPDLQQFGAYVGGIGINGASNNIASSQAFWVQANGIAPSLVVTEQSKTAANGNFLKPFASAPFTINATNSFGSDETAIRFENNATLNFDANYDAQKMTSVNSNVPRVASVIGTNEFAINQFPAQEIAIPIKITSSNSGLTLITFDHVDDFGTLACLKFEDTFTGITYDLATTSSFTTFLYDTTTVARFVVHIGAPINISASDVSCFGLNDGQIMFEKQTSNTFDVVWKDINSTVIQNNANVLKDSLVNLTAGTYYIESTDAACGNRTDTVMINEPAQITSLFTVVNDTISLGASISPTNQSLNAVSYDWNFGDGNNSTLASPVHTYSSAGSYLVNLKAMQSSNCFESYSKLITVTNQVTAVQEVDIEGVKTWFVGGDLNIQLNNHNYQHLEIRNSIGQLVHTSSLNSTSVVVDFTSYSKGVYFLSLYDNDNGVEMVKFIF